jgi:branched-chain amino acid transport system permease protein
MLRWFRDFQGDIIAIPGRLIALIFFILLFLFPLLYPPVTQQPYILRILIFTNMFVILAVSWDFISGYTGQMNFWDQAGRYGQPYRWVPLRRWRPAF